MRPIDIEDSISTLSDERLCDRLNFLSYKFCVNADFHKKNAVKALINELEMTMLEGLLRVLETEIGYVPFQNKIYEHVENIFNNQDSYNINRMMSAIRRTKIVSISPEDTKYIQWVRNRVNYGIKSIVKHLEDQSVTVE